MGIKPDTLRSAYRSALDAAVTHEMRSVAFCCISTGIYGYPSKHATPVALSAVREWLQEDGNRTKLDRIIFCVFETKDLQLCVTVFAL
jgi:O-acetyl-ADP-ribose deacetylase (regulator of RNase III)